jgi:hypothetical protein
MFEELIKKYFSVETVMKIINQRKASAHFSFDKFFGGKGKAALGTSVQIPIQRGAGVVLESVSPEAEHLLDKRDDVYLLTVALPRFPLEGVISAHELNQIKALDTESVQVETLAKKIGDIVGGHKESFATTLEYMAMGALFGKVLDGKGKALFEFTTSATPLEFKGSDIITSLNAIDDRIEKELGTNVSYDVLASRGFMNRLAALALDEKLFENNQARWLEEGGKRVLEVYGTKYIPYTATYKNTKGQVVPFMADGSAIAAPNLPEAYDLFYGRADHVAALQRAPELFFSAAPEELPKGRGYSIVSEMKAIPVCVRPGAIIKLTFSA